MNSNAKEGRSHLKESQDRKKRFELVIAKAA